MDKTIQYLIYLKSKNNHIAIFQSIESFFYKLMQKGD